MAAVSPLTLVLMGRTGNGKSATGNSILAKKAFLSRKSSSGITKTSTLGRCVRNDGQVINVIDTPGMFYLSNETGSTAKEIMKCMELASEGIHAVILVFSVRNRFTQEEEAAIKTLQNTFGPKIVDHTIVILTGGDEFDDDDDIEDYLSHECPVALKNILSACKYRCVVFDNKTKSEEKKDEQVNELLELVKEIIDQSGGQPYKPPLISNKKLEKEFDDVKRKLEEFCTQDLYTDPQLEEKLNAVTNAFQRQLEEETEARRQVEEKTLQIQKRQLEEETEARRQVEEKTLQIQKRQLEEEREARRQIEERTRQLQKQYNDEVHKLNEVLQTSLQRPPPVEVQQNSEYQNLIGAIIRKLKRLIRLIL